MLQLMCSENMTKSKVHLLVKDGVDAQEEPRLPRPKPYQSALIALLLEPDLHMYGLEGQEWWEVGPKRGL